MTRMLVKSKVMLPMTTPFTAIDQGAAIVEDGVIQAVGPLEELAGRSPFDREIGSELRHIALPGFVNAHHHATGPSRLGLFEGPLEVRHLWRLERNFPALTPEEAYYHTLWFNIDMIKGGVTSVIDLHGSDPRVEEMGMPASVQSYLDCGLRVVLDLGCSDRHRFVYGDDEVFVASLPDHLASRLRPTLRPFDAESFFSFWERTYRQYHGAAGRVSIGFGPAGLQWCTDTLLTRIRDAARERGVKVQLHLLETMYQLLFGRRAWGKTPVQHLHDLGLLGPDLSCAHGVWVSGDDCRLLAESGTTVAHNPASNLVLASGIAPVMDMLEAGVNVAFGLDALDSTDTNDYLTDLRLGWLVHRRPGIETRRPSPAEMLRLATVGGARALPDGARLGSLEPGKRADIVLLDRDRIYSSPYISPTVPVEEVILRRAVGRDVDAVIIDGRVVLEDRRVVMVDEARVREKVMASMERFLAQAEADGDFIRELEVHVREFYRRLEEEQGTVTPHYRYNTG